MSVIVRRNSGYGRKFLAGILLIGAAVCILLAQLKVNVPFLNELEALTQLSGWEMVAIVVCVLLFIGGIADLEPWQIVFPAGIVYCIIDEPLGLPIIEFWPMMLIAFILTVGLGMVFPEYSFVSYNKSKHIDREDAKDIAKEAKAAAKEAKEAAKAAKEAVKTGNVMDVDYKEVDNEHESNE
ncbi:MAG: hypothetical protein J5876_04850 [Lachnospiraceae bacterium]|nr:hypothetical protein [Lachnospiraceae bacterium]MBO4462189.1 hypothetical protein [Lachnospiraceae bacterium]MBR4795249.1 hypothetical protein [Lachnospiraceae bacterium]